MSGFLVLTRRPGESIIIGEGENEIIVTVVKIQKNSARISIKAPPNVKIVREEIKDKEKK